MEKTWSLALAVESWRASRPSPDGYDIRGFASLPIVSNGRIQPIDSLARNRLLAIHGKQSVPGKNAPASPAAWLAEIAFNPHAADKRPIFLIHHDELLGLLELDKENKNSYPFERIAPRLSEMAKEASRPSPISTPRPYSSAGGRLFSARC